MRHFRRRVLSSPTYSSTYHPLRPAVSGWVTMVLLFDVAAGLGVKIPVAICSSLDTGVRTITHRPRHAADGRRRLRHHHQPYLFSAGLADGGHRRRRSYRHRYTAVGVTEELLVRSMSIEPGPDVSADAVACSSMRVTTLRRCTPAAYTHIDTASQAAEALRPIGGPLRFALFAGGIIGTGMLAVPVLAGSAAVRGRRSVPSARQPRIAGEPRHRLLCVVAAATLGGSACSPPRSIRSPCLFWSAVVNGVVAVPIMLAMMIVVSGKREAKAVTLPRWLKISAGSPLR